MGLTTYSMLMKGSSKLRIQEFKRKVVMNSQEEGIKPTVLKFGVARNTVRRWKRSFEKEGWQGLVDKRKGPRHIPHKTPLEEEQRVLKARSTAKCYGPINLRYFFDLKASLGAIKRILRDHNLVRKRRKKHQTKQDLRTVKARYKAFEHIQMDIKHLYDIPPYWESIQRHQTPKYQYTIRDTKSGMLFWGFSCELSELNSRVMVTYLLKALRCWTSLEDITIQTDNGVEFSGTARKFEKGSFSKAIHELGARHNFIPPGCSNANGDVESIHSTVETEFFEIVPFASKADFLAKAESYRLFYNLTRPNWSKGAKTPWLIAQQDHPEDDMAYFMSRLPTLDLDAIDKMDYDWEGQTFPVLPDGALSLKSKYCRSKIEMSP